MPVDAAAESYLDDLAAEPDTNSRRRLRFSLLAFLLAITVVALTLGWLIQPNYVVATALFEVRNEQLSIIAKDRPFSKEDYELLKKTQIALLKSKYVLSSALVNPGIASLSVLARADDKEAWLQDHLQIEFPQDGEILSISLSGTESKQTCPRRCDCGGLQKRSPRPGKAAQAHHPRHGREEPRKLEL